MRKFRFVLAGLSLALLSAPAAAQSGLGQAGFEAWLPALRAEALRAGVRADTIDRVLPTLVFSARAVALDRQQPGGPPNRPSPPFAPYRTRHVTQALIDRGRARYAANSGQLQAISRRTGVPPAIVLAIWGKETGYGSIMGNFDLLNALASLAYEGRRRALFTGEFVATLRMLERGFSRSTLVGSWAGATGHPQFLPSVYLRLAIDGDGDGRADIWRSHLDGLASIGNYLHNSGWQAGIPWGVAARVPADFDRSAVANRVPAPRCAPVFARHSRMLTIREWRRLGVIPLGSIPDDTPASLIEPDGPGATAYLTTRNYRAILDYNCSNFYALTIGLLADAIGR
jgi:lytic murein transglycosylase